MLRFLARLFFGPSPVDKGEDGEMAVIRALSDFTEERGFFRYDNIWLPDGNNGLTEIDSVMFSRYAIFVLEVKNYGGWIYGKENDTQWTQVFNKQTKHSFQNPLHQNRKHLRVLRSITGLPESCFCNVVVFTGKAEFKTPMPDNVINLHELAGCILATAERELLSEEQVQNAISAVRAKHIR